MNSSKIITSIMTILSRIDKQQALNVLRMVINQLSMMEGDMKLAESIIGISEKSMFGSWHEGKKERTLGGNVLIKIFTDKKTGAKLTFEKSGLNDSEPKAKSKVILTIPEDENNKKLNKEIDWYIGKDKSWFTDGEIKSSIAKANKEISNRK